MNLKEYIRLVYELELLVNEEKTIINDLVYEKDQYYDRTMPKRPIEPKKYTPKLPIVRVMVAYVVIAILVALILSFILPAVTLFNVFFFVEVPIGIVFCLILHYADEHMKPRYRPDEYEQYQASLAKYNNDLGINRRLKQAGIGFVPSINAIQTKMADTKRLLDSAYSLDVIYPKYRDLVAVSSFYDYLMSGRCDGLEGANGAYNLYESEKRMDRIITQLDQVIANLSQIRQNQYMLFRAMNQINQNVSRLHQAVVSGVEQLGIISSTLNSMNSNITNGFRDVKADTAIIAYTTRLTEQEIAYRNMIDTGYSGR